MRFVVVLLCLLPTAGWASGFFMGGMADGMRDQQELDLQRRALDLDARDGGSRYKRTRDEIQQDRIRRQIEENNRLLREMERNRLLYGR